MCSFTQLGRSTLDLSRPWWACAFWTRFLRGIFLLFQRILPTWHIGDHRAPHTAKFQLQPYIYRVMGILYLKPWVCCEVVSCCALLGTKHTYVVLLSCEPHMGRALLSSVALCWGLCLAWCPRRRTSLRKPIAAIGRMMCCSLVGLLLYFSTCCCYRALEASVATLGSRYSFLILPPALKTMYLQKKKSLKNKSLN